MLLNSGEWYRVSFRNTNDPAWSAMPMRPAVPNGVIDAMVDGASLVIYVISAVEGSFAFGNGNGYGWDDSLLFVSAKMASFEFTDSAGHVHHWARADDGEVFYLDPASQIVKSIDAKQAAELAAFLSP